MNLARCVLVSAVAGALSCAAVGPYVWLDDYKPAVSADGDGYRIASGDLIQVRVYNQEGMSARERVRQDGKVSLPFLRDVQAAGFTPSALAEQLQSRLKDYINVPVVNVVIEEVHQLAVPVLGEVTRPGKYSLERGAGILEALAAAGGLNDFAHRDRIFVLRRQPKLVRIRTTYEALSHGNGLAGDFRLVPGDAVVVE